MFCCCHRDDVLGVVIQGHVGVLPNQDTLGPGNVSACNLGICTPSRASGFADERPQYIFS